MQFTSSFIDTCCHQVGTVSKFFLVLLLFRIAEKLLQEHEQLTTGLKVLCNCFNDTVIHGLTDVGIFFFIFVDTLNCSINSRLNCLLIFKKCSGGGLELNFFTR